MEQIIIRYNKKYIATYFCIFIATGYLNLLSLLSFLPNTPLLFKIDLVLFCFLIMGAISFGKTLYSCHPYVIISNKKLCIDMKPSITLKQLKKAKINYRYYWLSFRGKDIPAFYGIKTDFVLKKDRKILYTYLNKYLNTKLKI